MIMLGKRSSFTVACVWGVLIGCGSPDADRENRAPGLQAAPAEGTPVENAGFLGDVSGVVITTKRYGHPPNVYLVGPEGKQLLYTGAYAVKWIESWKALALANRTGVFGYDSNPGGREVKYRWTECVDGPILCDVSASGEVAALWSDGRVVVYGSDIVESQRVFTREWIQDGARVRGALYGSFVVGIALQPSGRYLAVTVGSEEVEETSGAAYPATALIDLETQRVRFLRDGAPIVWLDDETLVLLDSPYDADVDADLEAIVVSRFGKVLGKLRGVMAVGAGPASTVLLLREEIEKRKGSVSGPVFVEVRSKDLKVLLKRFDSGISDWREVEGFTVTYFRSTVKE